MDEQDRESPRLATTERWRGAVEHNPDAQKDGSRYLAVPGFVEDAGGGAEEPAGRKWDDSSGRAAKRTQLQAALTDGRYSAGWLDICQRPNEARACARLRLALERQLTQPACKAGRARHGTVDNAGPLTFGARARTDERGCHGYSGQGEQSSSQHSGKSTTAVATPYPRKTGLDLIS